jgi:hypothetical protein
MHRKKAPRLSSRAKGELERLIIRDPDGRSHPCLPCLDKLRALFEQEVAFLARTYLLRGSLNFFNGEVFSES